MRAQPMVVVTDLVLADVNDNRVQISIICSTNAKHALDLTNAHITRKSATKKWMQVQDIGVVKQIPHAKCELVLKAMRICKIILPVDSLL